MSDADASQREAAIHAALAELQQWGVDRFSMEGVAHRSRLSTEYLQQTWESDRQLILDALLHYSETIVSVPDTGSLREDLTELALAIAAYVNEPVGRRIARMAVVDTKTPAADYDTRALFWTMRTATIEVIFERAAARGELRDGVRPGIVLQLLTAPLHTFALYSDRPVDPGYCRMIADLVTRAIER
ncbi:TetR/AcrR family transcriptional regulator C-terminal ligand-binding domain-containing protein [Mycobacterium sp. NAZ190054]|uniref:TetR/AcrR family transcriptional regulator C-terminal ligand-binding domain-containing protein n=1 Tax=Mycobacterium sp. NAZ190054 TaxID=1747766 RepID=UPI00079BEB1C|nr:TetR/AcrR family transcriptional regulator C-terminal ligand-binding domain-containing protein [Mycobacterium sp. NAZ190054]KWX68483.1 TetR family transcriptional regulator [Mycobacterium sp. NAZ190054]